MKLKAYTIYDRKALVYHRPFFALADGEAVRMLTDLVSDTNTSVGKHPGDYVLYGCGGYDDQSGHLVPCTALEHIVDALAVSPRQEPLPFDPPRQAAGPSAQDPAREAAE